MKPFSATCKPFIDHLEVCGGCIGKRSLERCKYALECAVAEVLGRKGLVKDSKDLLLYSTNHCSKHWYMPEGCSGSRDVSTNDVGPCTAE